MTNTLPNRIKTISEFHELKGLPKPEHPLISVVNFSAMKNPDDQVNVLMDFYFIVSKRTRGFTYKYGHYTTHDFNEGILFFMSPNQVLNIEVDRDSAKMEGWALLIHPDFLWSTSLAKTIKQYEYFDYSINEALFLSEKEEATVNGIIENIRQEYHSNIDKFSKSIIITHIENLLSYAERFYHRQFITREKPNHQILDRLEELLTDYFSDDNLISKGLPTVQFVADSLNISANYLSDLLKVLTGESTQQHIHNKLIEKAKEKLSTTDLSISEIAYELGFEHPQSFTKLFKIKTSLSPLKFRQSFNA